MAKRTVIVRDGLRYKKRTQVRSRGGHVPRFSRMVAEAGGKKTAHRYVRRRHEIERRRGKMFQIKLTRSDGTLITEANGLLSYIKIYDSNEICLATTTPIYNTKTGYWSVDLVFSADKDPNGYWINYKCGCGFTTQYPGKVVSADKRQEADLIQTGTYEDTIALSCFQLRLTRSSDGALVTENNGLLDYIKIYAAGDVSTPLSISTPVYDITTEYWSVEITNNDDINLDGYWVDYKTPCSFRTQYPGESTHSGIRQEEDLIQTGTYEDTLTNNCFCMKLTRGDGTLLTDVMPVSVFVKMQTGGNVGASTIYNAETERWEIELVATYYWPENSYWVSYECEDGIRTQYPYKYKDADKGNVADLILPGTYEDTIPYWVTEGWYDPVPYEVDPEVGLDCFDLSTLGPDRVAVTGTYHRRLCLGDGESLTKHTRVKSSVPYTVGYSVTAREWTDPPWNGHSEVNHWFDFSDAFAIDNFSMWDEDTEECEDWGQQCLNTIDGSGDDWSDYWSDAQVMELTFTSSDGGISYVCKKDNLIDENSSEESGPTISGAVYSMTVENTTPSSHTGHTGSADECPSTGNLAWTYFAKCTDVGWPTSCDWVNVFGPGASYQ